MIAELIAVLIPWVVLAVIVPLLLIAVSPAVRLYCRIKSAAKARQDRKLFQSYVQRGFY